MLLPKKKSTSDDPAHYRPITVLSVLTRVLHKVVELELRAYITANNPFASVQAGFQPGRSTFDHLTTIHTLAGMMRAIRKDMVGAFLDVEKAFDKIPHWGLLEVLRDTIKLPAAWVEAIRLLLDSNSTTIFGHEVPITRGCLQGSPLSPLLCLCYLEDLVRFMLERGRPQDIPHPNTTTEVWILLVMLLYCDDIALLAISAATLQWRLDGVKEWTARRGLSLSPKSQALVLVRGPDFQPPAPLDAGLQQPMAWAKQVRYLGATFKAAPPPPPPKKARGPPAPLKPPLPLPAKDLAW